MRKFIVAIKMRLSRDEQMLMIASYGAIVPAPAVFLYLASLTGELSGISFGYDFFRFYFPIVTVLSTFVWIVAVGTRRRMTD